MNARVDRIIALLTEAEAEALAMGDRGLLMVAGIRAALVFAQRVKAQS